MGALQESHPTLGTIQAVGRCWFAHGFAGLSWGLLQSAAQHPSLEAARPGTLFHVYCLQAAAGLTAYLGCTARLSCKRCDKQPTEDLLLSAITTVWGKCLQHPPCVTLDAHVCMQ